MSQPVSVGLAALQASCEVRPKSEICSKESSGNWKNTCMYW